MLQVLLMVITKIQEKSKTSLRVTALRAFTTLVRLALLSASGFFLDLALTLAGFELPLESTLTLVFLTAPAGLVSPLLTPIVVMAFCSCWKVLVSLLFRVLPLAFPLVSVLCNFVGCCLYLICLRILLGSFWALDSFLGVSRPFLNEFSKKLGLELSARRFSFPCAIFFAISFQTNTF